MDQKGVLIERSEFHSFPIFEPNFSGFPKYRGRLFWVTFFGETKKVTGCRATPDQPISKPTNTPKHPNPPSQKTHQKPPPITRLKIKKTKYHTHKATHQYNQPKAPTMNPEHVMTIGRQAMQVTLMIAIPMLLVALVIGLLVSIFQAATQINEMTLSFIPKMIGVFHVMDLAGPWMLTILTDFMRQLFTSIPTLIN